MTRYPFTGPNYAIHGEVPGYIYYPWNDEYYIDPQMVQDYNESVGLAEPKPKEPGYGESLLAIAGPAAAMTLGAGVGQRIINGQWPSWLQFGSDTAAQQVVNQTAPQAGQIAMGGGTGSGAVAAGGELGGGAMEAGRQAYLGSVPSGGAEVGTFDAGGPIGSNIGTIAQGALGAAGLGLGMKGVYDAYESGNPLGGAISGAGAGAGGLALAGSLGAATGGLALPVIAGAALLGGGLGFLGDRETGAEQIAKRVGALQERGVVIPQPLMQDLASYGLSKDDLVAREQQKLASGQHGNPTFAQSRDVKDLTPLDTVGGLMWMETLGNDYFAAYSPEQRLAMNQRALQEGLITEGRGQLNFTNKERAKQIAQEVAANPQTAAVNATVASTQPPPPPTSSTRTPTPLNQQTLQQEGQKQIEKGNMQPAGMIPRSTGIGTSNQENRMQTPRPVQPTVQPQGMIPQPKPTPQMISQMQVPQQNVIGLSPEQIAQYQRQMGQMGQVNNFDSLMGYLGQNQVSAAPAQQPVGMIPAPVRTQTLSPGIGLDGRPIRY